MGAFAPSLPATMRPTTPVFPRSTRRSSILSQASGRRSEPLVKNATVVVDHAVAEVEPRRVPARSAEALEGARGLVRHVPAERHDDAGTGIDEIVQPVRDARR